MSKKAVAEIERWMAETIAARRDLPIQKIDAKESFSHYGIDSLLAIEITQELETWLGDPVPVSIFWDFQTIHELAEHLGA